MPDTMILRAITNCMNAARQRGWTKTYWAFDIHGTILRPTYTSQRISTEFYPGAREALQLLNDRKDIVKILYTCSYPHEILQYIELFRANGIHFNYINENPDVADGSYGYYEDKLYFNVLFEDKAGFDGETDWAGVKAWALQNPE